jgi:hypothetical protein
MKYDFKICIKYDFVLSLFTTQINTKNYGKCMYTFLQNISKNIYTFFQILHSKLM